MNDDYEFRVQVMDEIKNLKIHIDKLYSLKAQKEFSRLEDVKSRIRIIS